MGSNDIITLLNAVVSLVSALNDLTTGSSAGGGSTESLGSLSTLSAQ